MCSVRGDALLAKQRRANTLWAAALPSVQYKIKVNNSLIAVFATISESAAIRKGMAAWTWFGSCVWHSDRGNSEPAGLLSNNLQLRVEKIGWAFDAPL